MDNILINKLLQTNPWTEYRTRLDILEERPDSPGVLEARKKILSHKNVEIILNELNNWPGLVLNSHKSAGQLYHKLSFLAELGLNQHDTAINFVIEKIFEHTSPEGPFQLPMNIPVHFGGTGKNQYAWALCDAPILVYCLAKFGLINDERIIKAKDYLVGLGRTSGFPCAASKELGKFRGPGKKEDSCPYATLIMLKLMNLFDFDRESDNAKNAIDSLLNLWENSTKLHPFMFYMGTDFRKLKSPFIWYDILHLADTLSNFAYARKDPRFIEIVSLIEEKKDKEGFYTPESEWKAWKGWDFGQKKQSSAWLTFLVYRILKRMNRA